MSVNCRHPQVGGSRYYQAGYSLLEIAIGLLIIGALIGVALKLGPPLIENANLASVIKQVDQYRVASSTFQLSYNSLPGDCAFAKDHIDDYLINGNGDQVIAGKGLDPQSEAGQFWKHLAASGLIIDEGAPSTKMGGRLTVVYNPNEQMDGHWFLLGAENGEEGNKGLLTPAQAMKLDLKADNGQPKTGNIRTYPGHGELATSCIQNNKYNIKSHKRACIVYFKF